MLTLQEIRGRLATRRQVHVAEATGLSVVTLWRIRNGDEHINYNTLKKLNKYFEANP